MSTTQEIGLRFSESMEGYLTPGETDPAKGAAAGKASGQAIRFDVEIRIANLARFLRDPDHQAELTGTITFGPLGSALPIRFGEFNLFSIDAATGERRMRYRFGFTANDGHEYFLEGAKEVRDDPGTVDAVDDMTRLFTRIYEGNDTRGPIYGAGQLYFRLLDAPAMAASLEIENAKNWTQRLRATMAFLSFAYGALREEYLKELRPFYDTQYDNLVLSGQALSNGAAAKRLFFVSGTHDKGFPWGDGEIFWDVLLVLGERRFAMTDRVLDGLDLDLVDGAYRYTGPLYELDGGGSISFSEIRSGASQHRKFEAEIEIEFDAAAHLPANFPFTVRGDLVRRMSARFAGWLEKSLPGEHPLGIQITPHTVSVRRGTIRIGTERWRIDAETAFGEAEHGTFKNVKEPTLLYHYLCAPNAGDRSARVQIQSGTLRDEREHWTKDRFDALAGKVIERNSSAEIVVLESGSQVRRMGEARARPFETAGPPLIEVNNDHFPTAVFQRRVARVTDGEREFLALEEDMDTVRLGAINSDRTVRVASIRDEDKLRALDRVLEETGFFALLEHKRAASGKEAAKFAIVIKPNFMFAYNILDRSTYTDPDLVNHLAARLREAGYETVRVVEAQSTYGEYFDHRGVRDMAAYLGFKSTDYEVIDMTEDADMMREFDPPLGVHPVSRAWREADFRISFAKNKTHAYAYYTLTLKNIYGALPLANKFKEYHCDRDIYSPTIQYLKEYPIDYGLIDGHLSADGPFGIFADVLPNATGTVIGGADLVAVDWVGASKMGLEPRVSRYMQLAVEEFGKPAIELIGDASLYRPWLNVPVGLTLLAHGGMDADYRFGNLLYAVSAQMDETRFTHKSKSLPVRLLRKLTRPLRDTFFLRTNQPPTLGNRVVNRILYWMGY